MTDDDEAKRQEDAVYGPGAFCETCGHFAGRHNEDGCSGVTPRLGCRFGKKGTEAHPVKCKVFRWQGRDWPRPWLPWDKQQDSARGAS